MTPKPTITTAAGSGPVQQLTVRYRSDRPLRFAIFLLLIFIGYIGFTVASMVPQARAHFIDLLLHPNFNFFLSR